jgi:hypothetical protein
MTPLSNWQIKSNRHNALLILRNDEGMRDCLGCDGDGRIIIRRFPGDAEFFRKFGPRADDPYPRALRDTDLTYITVYLECRGLQNIRSGTVFKAIKIMLQVAP